MRTMTWLAAAAATMVTGAAAAHAQALFPEPPARLGDDGQYLVTSELALDYQRDVTSLEGEDDVTTTEYELRVGFDRVVRARLTLGLQVGFDGIIQGKDSVKRFGIGARGGGLVPLGRSTTWWPTIGLSYGHTTIDSRESTAATISLRSVTMVVSAPFLWTPASHLMFGVGPTYQHDLSSSTGPDPDDPPGPKTSGFGVHGLLGLWF